MHAKQSCACTRCLCMHIISVQSGCHLAPWCLPESLLTKLSPSTPPPFPHVSEQNNINTINVPQYLFYKESWGTILLTKPLAVPAFRLFFATSFGLGGFDYARRSPKLRCSESFAAPFPHVSEQNNINTINVQSHLFYKEPLGTISLTEPLAVVSLTMRIHFIVLPQNLGLPGGAQLTATCDLR